MKINRSTLNFKILPIKHAKKGLAYGSLFAFFLLLLIALSTYLYFIRDIRSKDRLMNRANTGLVLLDETGEPFFTFYNAKTSEPIQLNQIPQHTKDALIAAEDREYYDHPGFSLRGIVRAFMTNLKAGSVREGGSTISQELIKVSLLSPKRTYLRKYQELVLSIELTRRFSKDEILEMYLNSVYFGEGAFGIQTAAQIYFNKDAKDLTLAESALLIGLLPAPSRLSPISNDPSQAYQRQKYVLDALVAEGKITSDLHEQALNEELAFQGSTQNVNLLAPHFALYVKDLLVERYGEETIVRSGLKVTTTLNKAWQQEAETVVRNQVEQLRANNATNGAAVAIDPKTGFIKVMVGSYNWFDETNGKINMALAPRQPGSSFKPLIYARALQDRLITPATMLNDSPKTYADNYKPQNYDRRYRGPVTVRRALANSLNIPAVEVMENLGVNKGLQTAKSFHITSLTEDASNYGLSLVLGSGEVSLLEMTNAYAVFANNGMQYETTPIIHIEDKYGKKIYEHKKSEKRVISAEASYLISSILSDNNARAEIFGNSLSINRLAAVKTGTTEDYRDSLTLGYTPSLVVGVWVGNNNNEPMNSVAGSLGAAPIWRSLMQSYLSGIPQEVFPVPSNIIRDKVCLLVQTVNENRPEDEKENDKDEDEEKTQQQVFSYDEYFIKGTEPKSCTPDFLEQLNRQIEQSKEDEDEEEKENDDDENENRDDNRNNRRNQENNDEAENENEDDPEEDDTPESTSSQP